MNMTDFVVLLTCFSTFTSLITEALKKVCESANIKCHTNIVATVVAVIVGIGGTILYCFYNEIAITNSVVISSILMGLMSAVGAMVGYDKVVQALQQVKTK